MPSTIHDDLTVAPPKQGQSSVAKKTRQIRVDDDVADMADRLASLQNPPESTPVFLSEYLRPILRRDLAKALDAAQRDLLAGEPPAAPKKPGGKSG